MPTPYLQIRTSDRSAYKRCRRKWDIYSPIRQNLEYNGVANALWWGSGVHFALEDYHGYKKFPDIPAALDAYAAAFPDDERPMEWQDILDQAKAMMDYYVQWLKPRNEYKTLVLKGIPQVEVQFELLLPITNSRGGSEQITYHGTLDRVVCEINNPDRWWIEDYKTAAAIDIAKLETDGQITAYLWGAEQHYQHHIEGVLYTQISKSPPEYPRMLTKGGISTDKRQRTTHSLYRSALLELHPDGKFPNQYIEFLNDLAGQETMEGTKFIRWDKVTRNEMAKTNFFYNMLPEATEMIDPLTPIYPNPTRDCAWDCSARSICLAMDDGGDASSMLADEFKLRTEGKDPWRKRIKWPNQTQEQLEAQMME